MYMSYGDSSSASSNSKRAHWKDSGLIWHGSADGGSVVGISVGLLVGSTVGAVVDTKEELLGWMVGGGVMIGYFVELGVAEGAGDNVGLSRAAAMQVSLNSLHTGRPVPFTRSTPLQ